MAVAYVSGSGASGSSGATVSRPASIVAGNLLVAVACFSISGTNGSTITAPSGWTAVANTGAVTGAGGMAVFTKVATGSEPTSYAFGSSFMSCVIDQYSGAVGVDGSPVFNHSTSPPSILPSVTPNASPLDGYMGVAASGSNVSFGTPTGLTAGAFTGASANGSAASFHTTLSTTAATGTFSSSNSGTYWTSVSILLQPTGIAHVQDTPVTLITGAAGSIVFPANTTINNVICLFVNTNANIVSSGRPIPSGAGVTTWTLAPFPTSGTVSNVCMYYGTVTSSGSKTISLTDPSSIFWGAGASEFSGVDAGTRTANVNYDESGVTGTITVGPLTPTAAGQLAFIGNGNINGSSQTPYTTGSPWTAGTPITFSGTVGDYGNTDWLVTANTTALNPTYTYGGAVGMAAVAGIILAATSGVLTGTATLALGPLSVSTTSTIQGVGTATLPLGPLTTSSTSINTVKGTATLALGPLTVSAVVTTTWQFVNDWAAQGSQVWQGPYVPTWSGLNDSTGSVIDTLIDNGVWNPKPALTNQIIRANTPNNWQVSVQLANGNTEVITYPYAGADFINQNGPGNGTYPLSRYAQLTCGFSESMPTGTGTLSHAMFDIWLNNYTYEVMIQFDFSAIDVIEAPSVAVVQFGGTNGVPLQYWSLGVEGGGATLSWCLVTGPGASPTITSVQTGPVDILAMLNYLVVHGYLPNPSYLWQIGAGWEMMSTGGVQELYNWNLFTLTATAINSGATTVSLGPLTTTATSVNTVKGTATLSLGPLTTTSTSSTVLVSGTASLFLGPLSLTSKSTTLGTANLPLGPLSLVSASAGIVVGSSALPLGPLTTTTISTTLGTSQLPLGPFTTTSTSIITGAGSATLPLGPFTISATSLVLPTITGTASLPLGPLTTTAAGVIFATGTGTSIVPLGPVTLTATGVSLSTITGHAVLALGPLTVNASIFGTFINLGPLVLLVSSTLQGGGGGFANIITRSGPRVATVATSTPS